MYKNQPFCPKVT